MTSRYYMYLNEVRKRTALNQSDHDGDIILHDHGGATCNDCLRKVLLELQALEKLNNAQTQEAPQPEYCDCQGFHDGSCHARRIETLERLCGDLDEALADKKQFLDFSNNVAAYDHLIANEIDQERIKLLECLRANYMDDNK